MLDPLIADYSNCSVILLTLTFTNYKDKVQIQLSNQVMALTTSMQEIEMKHHFSAKFIILIHLQTSLICQY